MSETGSYYATTLRRMMVERDLTLRQVVKATKLHERTVKAILRGKGKPHARTLHALASGLDFDASEFFPMPDNSTAVVVPLADKPILERAAAALQSEYRDVLLGTIDLITKHSQAVGVPETMESAARDPQPCEATS